MAGFSISKNDGSVSRTHREEERVHDDGVVMRVPAEHDH